MATPENIDPLLDAQAAAIAAQAQLAMDTLMVMIAAGINPVDAVKRVQGTFNGAFKAQLQQAFTEVLGHAVSAGHIAALPVTGLPLSARLYRQVQQTSMEVGALVKAHNAGLHDARALAIRLYDGYNPKDGIQRPIEQRSLATLPKPLRELMRADITLKGSYEALLNEVQTAAARLKTGALKAAYTELIDKWIEGKGQESLQRKLDVAFKEKTRFHANRIAQTELARAHQDKVGSEFMQDDTITVVQVVMAPGHPLMDICDYHSRANLFNLGPGCYPKAKAPKPTFHPFCRCIVRSRPDLSAVNAREVSGGEAAYLRSLPMSDAARIVGSRDRLQRVLNGTPLDDVINAGKNPEYHLTRLGQLDLSVVHPARVPLSVGMTGIQMPQPMATQPNPAIIKNVPSFQDQKTVKAAAKWAVDNNLADFADYSGIKPEVANAWNQSLFDHLQEFPALRANQKFVGTAQAQFARWREIEIQRYILQLQKANPHMPGHNFRPHAESFVKAKKVDSHTYAHSWMQKDVSGIAVNKAFGSDVSKFKSGLKSDVSTLYHPVGCDSIRFVVDHEMAHQLDGLLDLSIDNDVIVAYNQAKTIGIKTEVSGYANQDIGEFIAECWAESCNNPSPRTFAQKIAAIVRDRYHAKYP